MTENVIPISKTPSQEKLVFVPPKLDWNENGQFRVKIERIFPTFKKINFLFKKVGDHASFLRHLRICLINHSARMIAQVRLAIGRARLSKIRNIRTSINLNSAREVNIPIIMMRMRRLSILLILHAFKSHRINVVASVVIKEDGKSKFTKKTSSWKLKNNIFLAVVEVLVVVFKLVT